MLPAVAALAVAASAPAALAAERHVSIPGKFFEPSRAVALVGDSVTWTNRDFATHDVRASDGSFHSPPLARGTTFSASFGREGSFSYLCSFHVFMRGTVDVFRLWLGAPARRVVFGRPVVLTGLAPVGTATVTIERLLPDGSATPVAQATPGPDGRFSAGFSAAVPGRYRAIAGQLASPAVALSVSPRLALTTRKVRSAVFVHVATTPAQRGAPVALERYDARRLAWVRLARASLDRNSKARFRLVPTRPTRIRVVLVRGVGGFSGATSRTTVVRP